MLAPLATALALEVHRRGRGYLLLEAKASPGASSAGGGAAGAAEQGPEAHEGEGEAAEHAHAGGLLAQALARQLLNLARMLETSCTMEVPTPLSRPRSGPP